MRPPLTIFAKYSPLHVLPFCPDELIHLVDRGRAVGTILAKDCLYLWGFVMTDVNDEYDLG